MHRRWLKLPVRLQWKREGRSPEHSVPTAVKMQVAKPLHNPTKYPDWKILNKHLHILPVHRRQYVLPVSCQDTDQWHKSTRLTEQ